ncbi:MAG: response regulator, partial [Spirochaetota bacterium]
MQDSDTIHLQGGHMDSKSILIVEDNVITARDIEASLQSLGYQSAGICESGEDAIDRIEDNSPDLILMDIELSGEIDGIQTANYIIERHSIPVIYLTSNNDLETISRTKESHPYGYLVKPA